MSAGSPEAFYTERIPRQFNQALDAQAASGDEGARVHEDMKAVTATMKVVVEGPEGGEWYLNIVAGRMASDRAPAKAPFLTLIHDLAAFEVLEREAGDSALGFLGGLAGLAGELRLTRTRLENLAGLSGCLAFALTGEGGFSLLTHFGTDPVPAEPTCHISVDGEIYRALRAGEMNPQDAFMSGKIEVGGDMQMAMQLALAMMSPE